MGRKMFASASVEIPKAKVISLEATKTMLGTKNAEFIKSNFSKLVEDVQNEAYSLYRQHQEAACSKVLEAFLSRNDPSREIGEYEFKTLNSFFLSLSQSRKTRAGSTFEDIVTSIFEILEYPFTAQPDLNESKPDYVIPSLEYYKKFAADCIIFTCKRTLRERWRQIVTEGTSGKAFFLATIDEKLSEAELSRMKDRSVYVVVPERIKKEFYPANPNVIPFEEFLLDHLDAALPRWKRAGAY